MEDEIVSLVMISPAQCDRAAWWALLCACCAPRASAARIREHLQRPRDWEAGLALAEDHGVLPLVAMILTETGGIAALPDSTRRRLEESRRRHLLFSLALTAEFFRLADRFSAAGIDSIVVKGPVLAAQAFGDPGLRQYLDLDILLRHSDVLRAMRIVEDSGFAPRIRPEAAAKRTPGQYLFVREKTRTIVELHTERTLRYFPRPIPIESLFARRVEVLLDGGNAPALSPEDTLVFICVHGSKHFWERLIWIADVAGLLQRQAALDWERVFELARETQTERMVRLGLCLARDVLGAELPRRAAAEVHADPAAGSLAEEIRGKLASGEPLSRTAWQRAILRTRMCTGMLRGVRYLLRLTFSPTEEDWGGEQAGSHPAWIEAVRRPLRLARKHHVEAVPGAVEKAAAPSCEGERASEKRKARV